MPTLHSEVNPRGTTPTMSFKAWRMRIENKLKKTPEERGHLKDHRFIWCDLTQINPKVADQLRYGKFDLFLREPVSDDLSSFYEEVQARW
jgi:hypothetical protein